LKKTFDPKRIEAIFTLVSSVRENVRQGALNAAMANMVKGLTLYLGTPMLKKEREILEEDFFDLLQKTSNHPSFASKYGPVSFRKGEHEMNMDFMKQLIEFGSESFQEKIQQGQELLEADRIEEARKIFNDVLDDPDAEIRHYLAIGDSFLKKQLWKDAQDVFRRAIEKDPDSLHVMNRMAISLRKDQKFQEALSIYKKAVMLSPRDEGLYYNVARLFLDWGKPKNAGQMLQKALAINPRFQPAAKLLNDVQESMLGINQEEGV